MSTSPNDGGPAFPLAAPEDEKSGPYFSTGMSLRDYFAGQMLAAAMSDDMMYSVLLQVALDSGSSKHLAIATACYAFADTMLIARSASTPESDTAKKATS